MSTSSVTTAAGKRVYVLGDIHGCVAETEAMLNYLVSSEALTKEDLVLFLGDYIDRGAESNQVLDLLIGFKKSWPLTRFLKGNHEDMMLDFLGFGGKLGSAYLYNGGLETIQSYGLSVFAPADEMIAAIPDSHLEFLKALDSILVVGNFICVHAGLDPMVGLDDQVDSNILWIREEFIGVEHDFGKTIIFGHTPHKDILRHLPYKIGLDTGLVFGHKLSCLELTSGAVFEVAKDSSKVEAKGKIKL